MLIHSHKPNKDFCMVTQDSLNLKVTQAPLFSCFVIITYLAFAWQWIYGHWIYGVGLILLFIITRNPFKVDVEYYMATAKDIHFSWVMNFLLFRLFCINGRLFVPNKNFSNIVNIRLKEYRRFQSD